MGVFELFLRAGRAYLYSGGVQRAEWQLWEDGYDVVQLEYCVFVYFECYHFEAVHWSDVFQLDNGSGGVFEFGAVLDHGDMHEYEWPEFDV